MIQTVRPAASARQMPAQDLAGINLPSGPADSGVCLGHQVVQ